MGYSFLSENGRDDNPMVSKCDEKDVKNVIAKLNREAKKKDRDIEKLKEDRTKILAEKHKNYATLRKCMGC